jgi:hypothetical protein
MLLVDASEERRSRKLAVVLLLILSPLLLASGGGSGTIHAFGRYSFKSLGTPQIRLSGDALQSGASVRYVLPSGAREGPGHWYILHLHARITIDASSGDGRAYLSGTASGYGAAQIVVRVRSGVGATEWDSVGMLNGSERHSVRGRIVDVRFANVIPYAGVRGGKNELHFKVDEYGARVESVVVLGDSAIEYTRIGPARLVAKATLEDEHPKVGRRLVVTLRLTNTGDRPARMIRVSTMTVGARLRLLGTRTRSVRDVPPRANVAERFIFVPEQPGWARLFFTGTSSSNMPGAEVDIEVRR